jgi:predicted dehydrogenase
MSRLASFVTKPGGGIGFDVGIYYLTALLSILGPVKEVSGTAKTRKPTREILSLEKFGESYTVESEDIMAGTIQFDSGVIGTMIFDSNSIFTFLEKPSMVIFGTMGVLYMADPNQFGGAVRVVLKGNNEPFVIPSSHAFNEECRGIGVAEMAWSIRQGRKHRANEEMAYHALEVLHGIVKSGESKSNQVIFSTFEKPRALPRGYVGQGHFQFVEENSIIK